MKMDIKALEYPMVSEYLRKSVISDNVLNSTPNCYNFLCPSKEKIVAKILFFKYLCKGGITVRYEIDPGSVNEIFKEIL